jgi:predicted nucleotide-binding protein (sugar kinase/HSP70/actin superfamily)
LLDAHGGSGLVSVYRRTEGNPVEAAKALVAEVVQTAPNPVIAVGLTGSGRDAAAAVFRAAYPELGPRLVVQNEIVAHAVAACRLDPDGGRSLSIVEIGGQDAKFINVEAGRVVDADMNRVCSAGTGSFLEEQAVAHGVDDIVEFGRLAARSEGPPDLGQTCTVFVADVAAEALGDGFTRDDIFAGLQQSVVRNYRSRVMGQRRLLDRVFFQGKPAADPSLARTLAAVLEREVYVPPDPGAMGAVGIALLAARALGDAGGPGEDGAAGAAKGHGADGSAPVDLRRVLEARVSGRLEFQCRDRDCRNLCRLELAEVDVAGSREKVVSGGQCPKYEAASAAGGKLPRDAPNPFREREELLAALLDEEASAVAAGGPRVGLPLAHYLVDTLPFFHTFLRRLGHDVAVLRPDADALAEGDRRCGAAGGCTPVKLLHGLAGADADVLVAPVFVHLPLPNAGALTYTCPMAQGAPDMVGRALSAEGSRTRVLRPVFFEREGEGFDTPKTLRTLTTMARALAGAAPGRPAPTVAAVRSAAAAALAAQRRFEAGLHRIGEGALAWARAQGCPVVLVAGETHVIHDEVLDCGIHELVAANGAVPLPVDCYPVPGDVPGLRRVHWASAGQTLRAIAAGVEAGHVFPLLLGAYGCGPNSMIEHLVDDLVGDWPHAVLESDGHGGRAGYVTRVQAFLHSVSGWTAGRGGAAGDGEAGGHGVAEAAGAATRSATRGRLARYDGPLPHSLDEDGYDRYFFGHIGGGLGRHLAAAMRGAGLDAAFVGEADAEALRCAGAACSGKECLPYQLIWGTLARFLQDEGPRLDGRRALFLSAGSGFQACRANLFPLTQQIVLDRLGEDVDVADFSLVTSNLRMMPVVWTALVAVDLLNMMRFYNLAAERERGAADGLFAAYSERLERMLEQPRPDAGLAGNVAGAYRFLDEVERLLAEAAAAFREQPADDARVADLRDVYLCGDIYLRIDEWGNDDLQRKLADHGLRVVFEPFGEFFELLLLRQIQDGVTLRKRPEKELLLRTMRYVVRRLLAVVRAHHPWAFWHDARAVDAESRRLTSGYPFGETIPTIGGALLTWRTQPVDGVVSVAPRGCGPALIAEAQLRREPALPALFVYNDGDPIDEARLAGFAWRLRSRPPRRTRVDR